MKINRYVIAISIIVLVVFIAINCTSKRHKPNMKTTHVDCDGGQSLAAIVAQSQKYTRIVVRGGTCQDDEPVVVTRDNIVIEGNGAVFDGRKSTHPMIIVKAKNVVIRDLTVTKGKYGIVIENGATAVLKNVNANGNSGSGIVVGRAMRLPSPQQNPQQNPTGTKPITLNQSTDNPLSAFFNRSSFDMRFVKEARADSNACHCLEQVFPDLVNVAFATLCGTVNANDNGDNGFYVNSNSTLEMCGIVNANNTSIDFEQQHGLTVQSGSVVNIHTNATLLAQRNASHGIQVIVDDSKLKLLGMGQLTSNNNQENGLFIGIDDSDESAVECSSDQMGQLTLLSNGEVAVGGNAEEIEIPCWESE